MGETGAGLVVGELPTLANELSSSTAPPEELFSLLATSRDGDRVAVGEGRISGRCTPKKISARPALPPT